MVAIQFYDESYQSLVLSASLCRCAMHFCFHCIWSRIGLSNSRRASVVRNLIPANRVQLLHSAHQRILKPIHYRRVWASEGIRRKETGKEVATQLWIQIHEIALCACGARTVYSTFSRRYILRFPLCVVSAIPRSSLRSVLLYLIRRCCGSFDKIKTVCLPRSNRCVHCDLCICPLPSQADPATSST